MRNRRRIPTATGPVPLWRDPHLLDGLALIAVSILTYVRLVAQTRTGIGVYRTARPITIGESLDATNTALADVRIDTKTYLGEGRLIPDTLARRSMGEGELVARASTTNEAEQSLRHSVVTVTDGLPSSTKPGDTAELWTLPPAHPSRSTEKQSHLLISAILVEAVSDEEPLVRNELGIEVLVDAGAMFAVLGTTSGQKSPTAVPVGAS